MSPERKLRRRIRALLGFFIACLVVSGLTAFPLESEMRLLGSILGIDPIVDPQTYGGLRYWVAYVGQGLRESYARYPFLGYGTDWLAFSHLVIAVAFLGPLRDPVRNVWVITFGMVACVGVIPMALIAGAIREIPWGWRLIDCSFGVFGIIPLWLTRRATVELEQWETRTNKTEARSSDGDP